MALCLRNTYHEKAYPHLELLKDLYQRSVVHLARKGKLLKAAKINTISPKACYRNAIIGGFLIIVKFTFPDGE